MAVIQPLEFFLQWHLTERCNLACRHCYQTGIRERELSPGEMEAVVTEVADALQAWSDDFELAFSPSVHLTGGEPLLHPDLDLLVARLGREGFAIDLLTNGTLVDRERSRRLRALGVRGVQVSLEGPEKVHDRLRGAGSFAAACRGVEALVAEEHPVTLNLTLSRCNASCLEEVVTLAADLGVRRLGFSRLVPSGRGRALAAEMLSTDEVAACYRHLLTLPLPGLEIVTGDPVAAQWRDGCSHPDAPTAVGGCAAGLAGLTLLPDGTLLPCRRLEIPLGNIRRDSLREIWATSPVLQRLRDRASYPGRCGRCRRWADCRGCRAIAWAASPNHDFLGDDPQCFLAVT